MSHIVLINISSDYILISHQGGRNKVPRGDLEIHLPKVMHELFVQDHIWNEIYVINGPGSFTNLRIGCLVLNMLKDFIPDLKLYTIAKYDLYTRLYELWCVPSRGLMYIGQQKNGRICDLKEQTREKENIDPESISKWGNECWLDECSLWGSDYGIWITINNQNEFRISYAAKSYQYSPQELWFELVEALRPNYILQPNISQPKNK